MTSETGVHRNMGYLKALGSILLSCAVPLLAGCGAESNDGNRDPLRVESESYRSESKRGTSLRNVPTSGESGSEVILKSLFWAIKDDGEDAVIEPITGRKILSSGTEIGWTIELDRPTFLYVIHRGPSGQTTFVFPPKDDPAPHSEIIELFPAGATLDNVTGLEQFYLIASSSPVESLEKLLVEPGAAGGNTSDFDERLLASVLALRKDFENVRSTAARPTRIGGSVRSGDRREQLAVEYRANRVFCRKFTIDHR